MSAIQEALSGDNEALLLRIAELEAERDFF